ncbi:MAG: PBP1A family penicillin-binding protein [Robiginitomaculum sp.]|nr:PBP1A family penicillin-binding protein [Robiginitomaculum sp.]
METFRADLNAVNDNSGKKKRRWVGAVLLSLLLIGSISFMMGRHYLLEGLPELPTKQSMWAKNLQPNITLLDKDGVIIGHRGPYYGKPLKLSDMPPWLPDAFLAIEDQRFWEHPGIDRKAIFRAVIENSKAGRKVQGGSTLTQQLVKNMVLTREKTYKRKFQEMWLAYKMEQLLSKQEILELYLNRIDLGNRAFGVEAASQRLFGKSAKDISLSEAAVLAAIPKAPTTYDPVKNPEASAGRARLVLQNMVIQGKISPQELQDAALKPAEIKIGDSGYLDERHLGHVFDVVAERAKELIGTHSQDLVVRTTLDPKLQNHGLNAISTIINKSQKSKKVSDGALVSIETETGAVRALIGGRDYNKSKFNRATQALRQPGSSFKAFVYATALEAGFTPGTVRIDQPTTIGSGVTEWSPRNYTRRYRGPLTLREALKLSINTVAAQVGAEVGPDKIVELAHRFGITTKLGANYSIALGSSEVHLIDMTSAFMVFANEGLRRPPYLIENIADTSGKNLYTHRGYAPERVYALPYARQMTGMLRDAVATGTGRGAKMGNRQVAGKTGTTQDYRDAWFIGFTADYTTGVWMGNDDNAPMNKITGGLLPVDAWKMYMLKAHKNKKHRPLNAPEPLITDPETRALIVFYEGLTKSFTDERNLANGQVAKTAGRQEN